MSTKISVFLFIIFTISSCVSHKDIVYFQGESIKDGELQEISNKPYRLQVDDILKIDIKAPNEELVKVFNNGLSSNTQVNASTYYFSGYSVDKQGFIKIPLLNKINVLGFTTEEVSEKILLKLGEFFKNTDDMFVSVKLAGFKYTVIGEVGSTGNKVLYQNNVNIIEAIANAGDIELTGDKTNVEIIRITEGNIQKFHIDLTQLAALDSEIFYIRPNDIIYVPALKQKSLGTGATASQSLATTASIVSLLATTYTTYLLITRFYNEK